MLGFILSERLEALRLEGSGVTEEPLKLIFS